MEGPLLDLTRSNPTPSSERVAKTLKHVLSFLDTLAFHIPEGTRCAVSILPTLNNPTLWRLVEDTATWQVGEAPQYASRPIDSGHDLIDHFITTLLSSSLHDGAGKAPHAVDEQVGENYPSALAEDDLGGDSPHATSQGDEGEEANPYDSGEAVWLEELDAASASLWDENMAQTANEVGSDVPSEDEVGQTIAKKTSVSQESQYSHAHATSNTDSSAMEADSIAREAEGNNEWKFDDTPETSEGVSTNQSHNSIEDGNHSCHTTDSSSGDRHEIFQSTKALRMVLKQNSPAGFHLFFSFLELIGWVLHLPVPSVRWPTTADSSQLLPLFSDFRADGVISHWVTTFSLSYTALLRIFNPVPSRAFRFSPLEDENRGLSSTSPTTVAKTLHDPAIMEKIMLLLLNTCPDVWLMSAILHCWWTSLLHHDHWPDGAGDDETRFVISTTHGKALEKIRRGKSNGVENGGAPRAMLMPRVEISLCVLLYHAGLNAHAVRSWRQRQLDPIEASPLSTGGPGPISDKGDRFDTRKWHAVHEAVLEKVFGDVLGETGGCDNEVWGDPIPESSLLHLIGSMTLLSLETRAVSRGQSGRRREACGTSDSSGKSPTAVGMPHSKNFYVAEFLVGDESRAAGSRVEAAWGRGPPVIFPSQQLASVVNGRGSSIGSSALHGRSWRYAWRYSLSPRQKMQLRRAFACRPSSPSAPERAKPAEGRKHRGYDRDVAGSQNMRHPSSLHEIDHSSNGKLLLAEDDDEFTNLFTSLMSSPNA
ncbi:unnamed protein product [Phytomonas sp. EM1]|nr:unnamed protein product [Phytomonas sp. EM1]|eukprot:CCW63093.1 unnamed protein product [Phytomonas sp. isolate EM1]